MLAMHISAWRTHVFRMLSMRLCNLRWSRC